MLANAFLLGARIELGANFLIVLGPAVVALAIAFWLYMTLRRARKEPRFDHIRGKTSDRGVVQGGVIKGSPSQRSRRDDAPRED